MCFADLGAATDRPGAAEAEAEPADRGPATDGHFLTPQERMMGIVARVNGIAIFGGDMRELQACQRRGLELTKELERRANRCCEILGIDPKADSVVKDLAEEIVLQGTLPKEAIRNIQQYFENQ